MTLDVRRQLRAGARSGAHSARMQAVHPVAGQAMLPPIEQRPRDPRFAAGRADADRGRTTHDLQAHPLYALVERRPLAVAIA